MSKNRTFVIRIASGVRTIDVRAPDMDTAKAEAEKELAKGEEILSTILKSYQDKLHGEHAE